jgi:quercetin dioxygenase-like cupin family protein
MPIEVFDYRTDVRNVVITPEIRSRFMKLEAGAVAPAHTHDLGHEVFIVLEGHAEFEVNGEKAVLEPGQMCFVRADEMHQVRAVGESPMTMYLSVTPHLEPTHTRWDSNGNKLPPQYGSATQAERAAEMNQAESPGLIADRHLEAVQALARTAAESADAHSRAIESLKQALANSDQSGVREAIDEMWTEIYRSYLSFQQVEVSWNELAPRADG